MKKTLILATLLLSSCAPSCTPALNPNLNLNDNVNNNIEVITSFEDCKKAGYPVMESYPEQCRTPDGKVFVQIISPANDNPIPNSRVKGEGEMCGGIAGFICAEGLKCQMEGNYPDAGGICVKEAAATTKAGVLNGSCGGENKQVCEKGLTCTYDLNGSNIGTCAKPNPNQGGMCAQVISYAQDPRTAQCWTFPTPCDVPSGWKQCSPSVSVIEADETGPETVCKQDADCWCRNFDGTQFLPGKTPSQCDVSSNRCAQCFYR